jgi:cytochrome P450
MTTQEPPLVSLDLTSQAFKQNPFPTLARLRAAGPLIRIRLPIFGKVWLATTYDAASDLLRDHQQFVQSPAAAGNRWMGSLVRWLPRNLRPLATHMLLRDPPDHRRLRSLVDQAFQRSSVEALRPRLEVLADEALDQLAAAAARSGATGGVDLVEHFARPFPLAVICELLGLPPEDRPTFTRWGSRFTSANSLPGLLWGILGLSQMMDYVRAEIRRQSRRPRGGLLAALIEAEEAGDRLSEDELTAMVFLLLAAGHETTLHQIAGSVLILLDHPEQLRELTADWSLAESAVPEPTSGSQGPPWEPTAPRLPPRLAESAVQELLRYLSFAQITKPRYARVGGEFCGQPIRRGQMLFACLASANADPSHFENPERLDLRRHPNRHLAFGAGIHVCLGAKLARVETEIALHRLFTRFPHLSLAVPRPQIRLTPRFGARGVMALPVKW